MVKGTGSYIPHERRVKNVLDQDGEVSDEVAPKLRSSCFIVTIEVAGNGQARPTITKIRKQLTRLVPCGDKLAWQHRRRLWILLPVTDLAVARTVADEVLKTADVDVTYQVYQTQKTQQLEMSSTWVRVWPAEPDDRIQEDPVSFLTNPMPAWKRLMDLLGAGIALVVSSPILVAAAAIIRCVSRGPVFFRQQRIGFKGQGFTMLKLRTYYMDAWQDQDHKNHMSRLITNGHHANGTPMTKLDDHPGIIPFGRFLRKTCIDELPQLLNVLKGQMSLVGPRPALLYEVEHYSPWHFERFDAVPGMTGLWQVSGKNNLTFDQMVSLDIQYTRRLSFWLDLWILAKTPAAIIHQLRVAFRPKVHAPTPGPDTVPVAARRL